MTGRDDKLTLLKVDFSMKPYNHLQKKNFERLSKTAQDFFYFVESFGKLRNVDNKVSIWMLEDSI